MGTKLPVRLLVCGGRNFNNRKYLEFILDEFLAAIPISCLIHGGARGADRMANEWAKAKQIPTEIYKAEWEKHGQAAGPIRNQEMLTKSRPDKIIAFPGGNGTANMVKLGTDAGISVTEIE